jgi:two-component system chemotaxis response regulator CheB
MEYEKTTPIEATCPECRGPLSQVRSNGLTQFECLVGHRYSVLSVLQAHCEAEEKALWSAAVALEEVSVLVESMASFFDDRVIGKLRMQAAERKRMGAEVRELIKRLDAFAIE